MTDQRCKDCEYMRVDNEMRRRCYSPQLYKLGIAGILINFERDDAPEAGRDHKSGTGKCGPAALNKKPKVGV